MYVKKSRAMEMQIIEDTCTCAGIIMVRKDLDQKVRILLVENKRKNYQFSFPKGKREKGEQTIMTAKRELHEETGLSDTDYTIMPNHFYLEYGTNQGQPHIVYYLAQLKNMVSKLQPIDTKEIVAAGWYTPDEIYGMKKSFYLQRRQITTKAIRDWECSYNYRQNGKNQEYDRFIEPQIHYVETRI